MSPGRSTRAHPAASGPGARQPESPGMDRTNGMSRWFGRGGRVQDAGWLRAAPQARLGPGPAWPGCALRARWGCGRVRRRVIALTGWALGSAVEGLASVIVIWRFTGSRTLSGTAEWRAQRGVAISFWLLAPYVAAQSAADLLTGHRRDTPIGIALTAAALLEMPLLGRAKHKLGQRLGSGATTGEGTQNYLCAAQAAAVLARAGHHHHLGRRLVARPDNGRGIAAVAMREGANAWQGEDCSC